MTNCYVCDDRNLKLDAFQRVDELQAIVYDQNGRLIRAHTAVGTVNGGLPSCEYPITIATSNMSMS